MTDIRPLKAPRLTILMVLCPVLFLGLAVIGGIRNYSPVPFWDMWDGYLGFYTDLVNGKTAAWWSQHNEHRILFTRLLFWLDLKLFSSGSTPFLIVCNYLLVAGGFVVFLGFLKAALPAAEDRILRTALGALIGVFSFAWVQAGNLTWAFQSQFFAAQIFPLGALYLLAQSQRLPRGRWMHFAGACLMGIAAAGTMANGVLTLPAMAVAAIAARAGLRRILVLAFLSLAVLLLYFADYRSPDGHGKVLDALHEQPYELLVFFVSYLGNPAYFFTGGSASIAKLIGTITLLLSAWLTIRIGVARRSEPVLAALLAYAGYLLASGLAVSGGRLVLGMEAAFASRYATPTLMLWATLLILSASVFRQQLGRSQATAAGAVLFISLLLLPAQTQALRDDPQARLDKMVAALALEMKVHDAEAIKRVYPWPDIALLLARQPSELDLSVFGHPVVRDAAQALGRVAPAADAASCRGSIDGLERIANDTRFLRVRGWIFVDKDASVPAGADLLVSNGKVVGRVITGQERPDVAAAVHRAAGSSGFSGYVLSEFATDIAYLRVLDAACRATVVTPAIDARSQ